MEHLAPPCRFLLQIDLKKGYNVYKIKFKFCWAGKKICTRSPHWWVNHFNSRCRSNQNQFASIRWLKAINYASKIGRSSVVLIAFQTIWQSLFNYCFTLSIFYCSDLPAWEQMASTSSIKTTALSDELTLSNVSLKAFPVLFVLKSCATSAPLM